MAFIIPKSKGSPAHQKARELWERDWPYTIVACVSRDWLQPTYFQATAGADGQGFTGSWTQPGDNFVTKATLLK